MMHIEPSDNYTEIHLLEVALHNYGSNKIFAGVAANLVAFACKEIFEWNLEGCTFKC